MNLLDLVPALGMTMDPVLMQRDTLLDKDARDWCMNPPAALDTSERALQIEGVANPNRPW
jgi:hypothetical protein